MRRMTALLAGFGGALMLSACGGSGGGNPITVISGSIEGFVVRATGNRDTASVLVGNTVSLSGTAIDGAGDPLALIGDTTWVSRDTTVATVDVHGLVTTRAVGNTWVVGSFTPKSSQTAYTDSVLVQSLGPS